MKNKERENNRQLFILIGTTNLGNDGGNDSGGSKEKDHPLFIYVLIGMIILAAILLVIIIIKIRRHKCMFNFLVSAILLFLIPKCQT